MTGRARSILYALLPQPNTGIGLMELTGRTPFIYGTVRALERDGYVRSFELPARSLDNSKKWPEWYARGNRPRRYYMITTKGQAWLNERKPRGPTT